MKIAFVALESFDPARGGGQLRMSGIVSALRAAEHEVRVFTPEEFGFKHSRRSLLPFLSLRPRQGNLRVSGRMKEAVAKNNHDVLFLSISYLAPMFSDHTRPIIVDFQNIEGERFATIARAGRGINRISASLESLKARWWEPRAARAATLSIACTAEDQDRIGSWGASVCLVPHSCDPPTHLVPSPCDGPALLLGSGGYKPNDDAMHWFLSHVWPLVMRRAPSAKLRVVGRYTERIHGWAESPSVNVVGEVEYVDDELRGCAVVIAPVVSGAGAQLKVVTALAHGRTIVATTHSVHSVPPPLRGYVSIADTEQAFSEAVIAMFVDVEERHRRESALLRVQWSWASAARELNEWLDQEGLRRA